MKIHFTIRLQPEDLFRFHMHRAYTGLQGWLSVVCALIVFGLAGYTGYNGGYGSMAMYIVIGVFLLIYVPAELWRRAKKSLKTNDELANELHYELSEEGIHVTQGDASADLPWTQIYKVTSDKHALLIYSSRIAAYIIPRSQVETEYDDIAKLLKEQVPSFRLKLK